MRDNSKQASFADFLLGNRTKVTRTEKLLQRINEEVDFSFAHEVHNKLHKAKTGRRPYSAVLMYKIVLLQNLFGLSDAGAEEAIYDRKSFQDFLGLNLNDNIPDESSIGRFRNALVEAKEDENFFQEVDKQLEEKGIMVSKGKSVDATIIEVPKGRKKEDGTSTRDKDASFTKKNDRTYHGFKGNIATDTRGEFIKTCHTSTAKDHDSKHIDKLLDGKEEAVFGDSAYASQERKKEFRKEGKFYGMIDRASRGHPLSSSQKKKNKKLSSIRCRVEHPFAEIKCRMNFKARYRGIRKNEWQFKMVCAVYNLKRVIGQIYPPQRQAVAWIN